MSVVCFRKHEFRANSLNYFLVRVRAFFAEENRLDYAEIPKCLSSSSSIHIDILFLLFVLLSKEEEEEKKPRDDAIKRLEGSCV